MDENTPLLHLNELHLIEKHKIATAVEELVESLDIAAGSTAGFDLYRVVESYFTNLEMRHTINQLLQISEADTYFDEVRIEQYEKLT